MQSFYGGPAGQSFEIKQVFSSYYGPNGAQEDLTKGWASSISVGEFIMVSYGKTGDTEYWTNYNYDIDSGDKKNLNSTLWQKVYDESAGTNSGLTYKFITSCIGNTPKIMVTLPARVLNANEEPKIETDLSNPDLPVISFELPQSQVLSVIQPTSVLNADEEPSVEYDNDNINRPTLHFNIPQSQVIKKEAEVTMIRAGEAPTVILDTDADVNRPTLKFQLPATQEFLSDNITHTVLNANESPSVSFTYDEGDTLHEHPILNFELPRSQVMDVPETEVQGPKVNPSVENVSEDVNAPRFKFNLPRAVAFYCGDLLGQRPTAETPNETYTVTDTSFESYEVGDCYVNAPTGFVYTVITKNDNTTCEFKYQACFLSPLPSIKAGGINPYVQEGSGYDSTVPRVDRILNTNGTIEWELQFGLPRAPKFAVSSSFVGSAEQGTVSSQITSENTVTLNFKIPAGSRMFAGLEITADGATTTIDGAKSGDVYLNSETGILYTLTTNGSWKASEKSIKGPTGDALNIIADIGQYDSIDSAKAALNNLYANATNKDLYSARVTDSSGDIAYWFYKTETQVGTNNWSYSQLTGAVSSFLTTIYTTDDVDNKAYSVGYINSLSTWGTFEDLLK